MAEMGGLEFLVQVKKTHPHTEVAIMTGYGSIESAVQAMKLGAYDYITKPFRVEELKLSLQRMAEKFDSSPRTNTCANDFRQRPNSTESSVPMPGSRTCCA
jgi:DNA-binding NtrC family response regulator